MTLSQDDKNTLSDLRFRKAEEFLDDARANLEESRLKTSINRSYYSALNAVRALLILEGVNPESHAGCITTLSLHFIKNELLPVDVVKRFKRLLSRRADVDYGDFETVDESDASDSIEAAEYILSQIDTLRKSMIEDSI